MNLDPFVWARFQLELDAREGARFPDVLAKKAEKLAASPFGFFRGTAPLFYASLAENSENLRIPGPVGAIVGDAHLENFGAFRVSSEESDDKEVMFDVNDFDEVGVGPLGVDAVRLGASLLLASRELRISGREAATLLETLVDAYSGAAEGRRSSETPGCVEKLLEKVKRRSKKEFLEKRTVLVGSKRRFVRGERYSDVRLSWTKELEEALPRYAETLVGPDVFPQEVRELEDAAFRIAGTGSLGCVRIATLHKGKGGEDGKWLLDWKEERSPALGLFAAEANAGREGRIREGMRTFLPKVPRMLGEVEMDLEGIGSRRYLVRRLTPQEDKLDLGKLEARELPGLVAFLGEKLGTAHVSANPGASLRFDVEEKRIIVEGATRIAGFFESVFLAHCFEESRAHS